jgi:hypothetical protein
VVERVDHAQALVEVLLGLRRLRLHGVMPGAQVGVERHGGGLGRGRRAHVVGLILDVVRVRRGRRREEQQQHERQQAVHGRVSLLCGPGAILVSNAPAPTGTTNPFGWDRR